MIGAEAVERLRSSKVIIFGIGGVGGYALEVIARSGVGEIAIVDADEVETSNINRQILALHSTVGRRKVEVARQRILDINPDCKVTCYDMFYSAENADSIDLSHYDYIVDCIDSVDSKMELIRRSNGRIISALGAGRKQDPTQIRVSDIYQTTVDPLAKVIRKRCRQEGIARLKVAWSAEPPSSIIQHDGEGKNIIASNAFVPAAMGIVIGSEVVKWCSGGMVEWCSGGMV